MKLSRLNVLELNLVLEKGRFAKPTPRYAYKSIRNRDILTKEVDTIDKAFVAPDDYVNYLSESRDVYATYGITSETDVSGLSPDVKAELDAGLSAVSAKYEATLAIVHDLEEQKQQFLMETTDLALVEFEESEIPQILSENLTLNKWSERDVAKVLSYITPIKKSRITTTVKGAIELNAVLNRTVFTRPFTNRFAFMLAANSAVTADVVNRISNQYPYPDGFVVYENKRKAIFAEFKITTDEEFKKAAPEIRDVITNSLMALDSQNAELLTAVAEVESKRSVVYPESVDLDLVTVTIGDVPEISDDNEIVNEGWDTWTVMKPLQTIIVDG